MTSNIPACGLARSFMRNWFSDSEAITSEMGEDGYMIASPRQVDSAVLSTALVGLQEACASKTKNWRWNACAGLCRNTGQLPKNPHEAEVVQFIGRRKNV